MFASLSEALVRLSQPVVATSNRSRLSCTGLLSATSGDEPPVAVGLACWIVASSVGVKANVFVVGPDGVLTVTGLDGADSRFAPSYAVTTYW